MKISGRFYGKLTNPKTGEIICWDKHNKVVQVGFNWIASLMSDKTTRQMAITHIAFGTGTTATDNTMIALQNEVFRAEVTSSWNPQTRELTFEGGIPKMSGLGDTYITEVGLFNAEAAGVMFDRATFSAKGIDENMSFDYKFVVTITE